MSEIAITTGNQAQWKDAIIYMQDMLAIRYGRIMSTAKKGQLDEPTQRALNQLIDDKGIYSKMNNGHFGYTGSHLPLDLWLDYDLEPNGFVSIEKIDAELWGMLGFNPEKFKQSEPPAESAAPIPANSSKASICGKEVGITIHNGTVYVLMSELKRILPGIVFDTPYGQNTKVTYEDFSDYHEASLELIIDYVSYEIKGVGRYMNPGSKAVETKLSYFRSRTQGYPYLPNVTMDFFAEILTSVGKTDASWSVVGELKQLTSQMMKDFGWPVSDSELTKIIVMLNSYKISDMRSIRLFMATCGHESGKGTIPLEDLNPDGTVVGNGYDPNDRGAGYIQITKRETHLAFLKSVNDSFTGLETAKYIAENYPWEAAGWFWSSAEAKSTSAGSLNDYTVKYGDSKSVFFLIQCWVNGWPEGLTNDTAVKIRDGQVNWNITNKRLFVNGVDICREPENWDDRNENYEAAKLAFK